MKRLALAAAVTILAFGAAACDSDSPTTPSSDIVIFTVQLSALNEIPPITNAEATARGTAVITINKAANTVDFNVSLNSFPAGSTVRVAHIHGPTGHAGANAGIVVDTTLAQGDVVLTNGAGTFSFAQSVGVGGRHRRRSWPLRRTTISTCTPCSIGSGGAIRGQLQ